MKYHGTIRHCCNWTGLLQRCTSSQQSPIDSGVCFLVWISIIILFLFLLLFFHLNTLSRTTFLLLHLIFFFHQLHLRLGSDFFLWTRLGLWLCFWCPFSSNLSFNRHFLWQPQEMVKEMVKGKGNLRLKDGQVGSSQPSTLVQLELQHRIQWFPPDWYLENSLLSSHWHVSKQLNMNWTETWTCEAGISGGPDS